MKVIINTGNEMKFSIAQNILSEYGIECERRKIDTPEIQAETNKEIAEFSARFAHEKLGEEIGKELHTPVVVTDAGYYITTLGGFPGPFVKYMNNLLSADDILNLMRDKENREVIIREYLSIAFSKDKVETLSVENKARISEKIFDNTKGSTFDKIIIREGFEVPQNMMSKEELDKYFKNNISIWHELGKKIISINNI